MRNLKKVNIIFSGLILPSLFIISCSLYDEKTEKKSDENDEKTIVEYYKQFDSTITKEELDSFKKRYDSLNRWRDSKIKKIGF